MASTVQKGVVMNSSIGVRPVLNSQRARQKGGGVKLGSY